MLRAFLVALQFLTVLPVHFKKVPDNKTTGYSLLLYPVVGLLMGLLLAGIGWAANGLLSSSVHAAIILTSWIILTGGLHLDGLADSADAWVGGLGDRKRTLAIMKDPYCGPAAVVPLVLTLLIKFTAIDHLITTENWAVLALIPALGRTMLILLLLTTTYVRKNGIGSTMVNHLPARTSMFVVFLSLPALPVILGVRAFWLIFVAAGVFFVLRMFMLRRKRSF